MGPMGLTGRVPSTTRISRIGRIGPIGGSPLARVFTERPEPSRAPHPETKRPAIRRPFFQLLYVVYVVFKRQLLVHPAPVGPL
jgi:hypothetical protein